MTKRIFALSAVVLALLLTSCSIGGTEEPTPAADPTTETTPVGSGETVSGTAQVDSVDVLVLESFPVQVNVIASGNLPDGCTRLEEPQIEQADNSFTITLPTTRPADAACTLALAPFDKVISLPVEGLAAGAYTVSVNGVSSSFTLDVDNVAGGGAEETPEAVATAPTGNLGAISGRVWHDICAIAGGEGGEPAVPSDGCVPVTGGGFAANAVLESEEPALEGVQVSLGEGACGAATEIQTTTTNNNGYYSFTSLEAGTYCITIDPLVEPNVSLLIPGAWTFPASEGVVESEVTVSAGNVTADINFGWDYQFLPDPDDVTFTTPTAPGGVGGTKDCTDSAGFVADVTIPDDTIVPAGTAFTKTWRLVNTGTCTWNTDYSLVFVTGDQMSAPAEVPLHISVPPSTTVDLSVGLVAPDVNGTYRADFQLRNELGQRFGIPEPDVVFWVQIAVLDGEANGAVLPETRVVLRPVDNWRL